MTVYEAVRFCHQKMSNLEPQSWKINFTTETQDLIRHHKIKGVLKIMLPTQYLRIQVELLRVIADRRDDFPCRVVIVEMSPLTVQLIFFDHVSQSIHHSIIRVCVRHKDSFEGTRDLYMYILVVDILFAE